MGLRFSIGDLSPVRGTLILALSLIFFDAILDGSYLFSLFVCPIWLLVALVRAGSGRASPRVAAARILAPVVTGLIVVVNSAIQGEIAMAGAARIIQACERYREDNGSYPEKLGDLVPRYLSSIPRAKYCCAWNEFAYYSSQNTILWWTQIPPFGRRAYSFVNGDWRYVD